MTHTFWYRIRYEIVILNIYIYIYICVYIYIYIHIHLNEKFRQENHLSMSFLNEWNYNQPLFLADVLIDQSL